MSLDNVPRKGTTRRPRDSGAYVPSELWSEILKRLPAKKLVQLQCVCKSWKSLITSSFFVGCHYNLNTITGRRCSLQLTKKGIFGSTTFVVNSCALRDGEDGEFEPLGYPEIPDHLVDEFWSPGDMLHGVIFLRYLLFNNRRAESLLCVWNPCVRKHVTLPWPSRGPSYGFFSLVGAWFDAPNNDLKVVRSQLDGSYDLLSVRNGVWRMNLPLPPLMLPGKFPTSVKGFLFNGSIHWILGPDTRFLPPIDASSAHYEFLRFDCQREEFNFMDMPSQLVKGSMKRLKLILLDLGTGTMLSLAKFVSHDSCELWFTQTGSSWTRLDTTHPDPKFAAAAAGDVISSSGLTFKPLIHQHARFKYPSYFRETCYHFNESIMLMDIETASSSVHLP